MSCVSPMSLEMPVWHTECDGCHSSDGENIDNTSDFSDDSSSLSSDSDDSVSENQQISAPTTSGKRKRRKYSYDANMTFSWKADREMIFQRSDNTIEILPFAGRIQEHAFQRMQIFYIQALAFYNTGATVRIVPTSLQHGTSGIPGMSSAHSCLLPGADDNMQIITGRVEDSDGKKEKHLRHIMNVTVEMPHQVNEYDVLIEGKFRSIALSLLNQCSKKGLHPYSALEVLVEEMQEFLADGFRATISNIIKLEKMIASFDAVIDALQSEELSQVCRRVLKLGKLINSDFDESKATFSPQMKGRFSLLNPFFDYFNPYFKNCTQILHNLTTRKQYCKAATNLKKQYAKFPASETNPLELLDVSTHMKVKQIRKRIEQFLDKADPIGLLPEADEIQHALKKLGESLREESIAEVRRGLIHDLNRLYDTVIIINQQMTGTEAPPYCFLSGQRRKGKIRGMTDKELVAQQKALHSAFVVI
ncbi:hypothetical protein [Estrella lausannensis]|uniref:Uncharacterized protein n=1 Tax=Estrella lausannensis TaxID=483423 RepID=A0A0H5DRH8_9BACT|nr:hypothetical protein [Estrella lausannensis]CRX38803.1 hypothetical protein ELAC_1467 [Estrella lausannensis]